YSQSLLCRRVRPIFISSPPPLISKVERTVSSLAMMTESQPEVMREMAGASKLLDCHLQHQRDPRTLTVVNRMKNINCSTLIPGTITKICSICNMILGNDVKIVNSHIDIRLANSANAPCRHHQPNVASVEAIETTSCPLDGENSTVYLVGIPQNFNEAHIINMFSAVFGDVLCCKIGSVTRIAWLKFACDEFAKNALAAESVIIPPDEGGEIVEVKIKKNPEFCFTFYATPTRMTATLYVGGSLGNFHATNIQNHLSEVFKGHWKCETESRIQDVLAFDCDFEAAEKALALQKYEIQII
ncbi:hypothetical protein BC938DRAFT_476460, partial [Jimgerdemannia flammicorona]